MVTNLAEAQADLEHLRKTIEVGGYVQVATYGHNRIMKKIDAFKAAPSGLMMRSGKNWVSLRGATIRCYVPASIAR
jgi:hypothetical protein